MKTLINLTPTIEWVDGYVNLIDQTKLPLEESYIKTDDYKVVCESILRLSTSLNCFLTSSQSKHIAEAENFIFLYIS